MPASPEVGDKVSWNYGGGAPGGTVAEKKTEGEVAITSKRGNKIKKNAEPDNPAVHIERSGNDVVKKASELTIEKKGSGGKAKKDDKKDEKDDSDSKAEKRKHDDDEDKDKDKTADEPLVENKDGKEVRAGGKTANKKQKKEKEKEKDEPAATTTKKADKKEEEEKKAPEEKPAPAEKKKPGRPKKSETKEKKDAKPREGGDLVSTRTRSQKK